MINLGILELGYFSRYFEQFDINPASTKGISDLDL